MARSLLYVLLVLATAGRLPGSDHHPLMLGDQGQHQVTITTVSEAT